MKRGFLQSSGTAYRASKTDHSSDISSKPDRSLTQDQPQETFKIPAIVIIDQNIPSVGRFPGGSMQTQVVKLPYDDDSHTTEPYTVSLLYTGAKEAFAAIPEFPTPYRPSIRVHYRIGDAPGAGKGMLALTDLHTGDLIARERPLCLFPAAIPSETNTYAGMNEVVMQTLLKMKPADIQDYFDLTNCKTGGRPAGILRTNGLDAYRMPGEYDGKYTCICRDLCRANHRSVAAY